MTASPTAKHAPEACDRRPEDEGGARPGHADRKPGVITPGQPGGPSVGNFHQITHNFNGKRAGILWNRQAKGGGWPPWSPCMSEHPCREHDVPRGVALDQHSAAIHSTPRPWAAAVLRRWTRSTSTTRHRTPRRPRRIARKPLLRRRRRGPRRYGRKGTLGRRRRPGNTTVDYCSG